MASHVDLVENRWSAGYQERVGRAYRSATGIEIDTDDEHYRDVVLGAGGDRPKDPEGFLASLPGRFHSDYFFATEVHDDDVCPFAHGDQLPFRGERVAHPAGSPS